MLQSEVDRNGFRGTYCLYLQGRKDGVNRFIPNLGFCIAIHMESHPQKTVILIFTVLITSNTILN
jgi:hypothetical protein